MSTETPSSPRLARTRAVHSAAPNWRRYLPFGLGHDDDDIYIAPAPAVHPEDEAEIARRKKEYYWSEVEEGFTNFLPAFLVSLAVFCVVGAGIGLLAGALLPVGAFAGVAPIVAALPIVGEIAHVFGAGAAAGMLAGAAGGLVFGKEFGLHVAIGSAVNTEGNLKQDEIQRQEAQAREVEKQQSRRQIFSDVTRPLGEMMQQSIEQLSAGQRQIQAEMTRMREDFARSADQMLAGLRSQQNMAEVAI